MALGIADIFGGNLLDGIKGIISQFHMSPEQKAQIQAAIEANADVLQEKQIELEEKLNEAASANIVADSSSSDWFVRRARPLFIWVIGVAIGINLIIFPLVNLAAGSGLNPLVIPAEYLSLFKYALCGYSGLRTIEKITNRD